jgi:chromosome segregation ATPase
MTGLVYPDIANAADKQDKSARRAALMMQKMKQDMEAEKAAMQVQFDEQKKELEDKLKESDAQIVKLNKSLQTSQRKVAKLEGDVVKLDAEKTALASKLQQTQFSLETTEKNLEGLKVQYSQAQADLRFNDGQRKTLSTNLALTNKSLSTCEQKNIKLHQFGTELIQIYDKPTTYEAVMRKESFFQLKRVELENILQTYQDNLNSELIVKSKPAS